MRRLTMRDFWLVLASRRLRYKAQAGEIAPAGTRDMLERMMRPGAHHAG